MKLMIDRRTTKAYKLEKENRELKKEIERQDNLNKQLVDECQRFEDKVDTLKIEISSLMSRYFYEKDFQIEDTHLDKLLRIIDNDIELKESNEPTFEEMVNFVENVCQDIKNQSTLDEELKEERERIAKIVGDFKEVNK